MTMSIRLIALASVFGLAVLPLAGCYVGPVHPVYVRPAPVYVRPPPPVVVAPHPYGY